VRLIPPSEIAIPAGFSHSLRSWAPPAARNDKLLSSVDFPGRTTRWVGMNRGAKIGWVSVAVGGAVVVALLVPTALSGWAPLAHWTCVSTGTVASKATMFFPAVLVNAPYGGEGYGSALEPASFPGAWGYPNSTVLVKNPAPNGSAVGQFFAVNVSVHRVNSVLALGPGDASRCRSSFAVSVAPPQSIAAVGWVLLGPGNTSDAVEPTSVNFTGFQGDPVSPQFENGFSAPNLGSITTCQTGTKLLNVSAQPATVEVPFSVGSQNYTVPFTIPFQLQFQYWFPAQFGTWQIDNLSAPGGPGGGWAFSYSPCD